MNNRQKVKQISTANRNIINYVETISYGTTKLIALLGLEYNLLDFATDGICEGLYNYPKQYAVIYLSPIIIGTLINKFDKNSETANDIKEMINQLKPKVRKKERL